MNITSNVGKRFLTDVSDKAAEVKKAIERLNAEALKQVVSGYGDLQNEQYTLILGKEAEYSGYAQFVDILKKRAILTFMRSEFHIPNNEFKDLGYTIIAGFPVHTAGDYDQVDAINLAEKIAANGMIAEVLSFADKKRTAYTPFGEDELPWAALGLPNEG